MPDWLQVILLGVIEGITEFLPISSTGHLLLAEKWIGERPEHFTIFIQSGAVLAVLAVFRERVVEIMEKWREMETQECFNGIRRIGPEKNGMGITKRKHADCMGAAHRRGDVRCL